jgi:iron complex transport system substrate-binding protein
MRKRIEEEKSSNKNLGGEKEKMKTKTKMIVLLEIAIVLCSVFLVTLPRIAAEQNTQKISASTITTVSEDDYVLGIYGNANEDDTIDMRDLTYVKLIFFGKKSETELADAKYDGEINPLDFIQIKLIIVGKEKELTVVDFRDNIVTVNKPVKRIIPFGSCDVEVLRSLKAKDKIIAVSTYGRKEPYFSEFVDLPCVGDLYKPDYEVIVELQPELFLTYANPRVKDDELANKLKSLVPGAAVLRFVTTSQFGCSETTEDHLHYLRKLGYILDRKDEAEELIDFYTEYLDTIKKRTAKLSADEKPTVFHVTMPAHYFPVCHTVRRGSSVHQVIEDAGGINIAADLEASPVDSEWVLSQNPEITLATSGLTNYRMDKATEADMEAEREEIMSLPGWGNFKVYLISGKFCSSTCRFIGTAYLAKIFHPKLFEDLDPQAIHQEYLDRFQGIDYNVYERVFVYPPLK